MKRTLIELIVIVGVGLFFGYVLLDYPPEPPPGICDAEGTAESCTEWWLDTMERP